MARLSEGQEARQDVIDAIHTYGTTITRTRGRYKDSSGVWHPATTIPIICMPDLLVRQNYPGMMQAFGITNQAVLDNHDVFYFLPDADIKELTDTIFFDGFNRGLTLVKNYPIANVNIVKIAFVVRDSKL